MAHHLLQNSLQGMVTKTRKKRIGQACNQEGFTLVESMIAVAVLTISLLSLAQLMTVAFQQSAFSRYNTMAIEVAYQKFEQLRTQFNNELVTGTAESDLTAGSHPSGSPGYDTVTLAAPSDSAMGDYQFQVSWIVAVAGNDKTVTVTVDPMVANARLNGTLNVSTILAP